jgi:hypothetical protein
VSTPEEKRRSLTLQYELLLSLSNSYLTTKKFGKSAPRWSELRNAVRMAIRHAPVEYELDEMFKKKENNG